MLGLALHDWEAIMLVSLAIAGIFAVAVAVSTYAVVKLQRLDSKEKAEEFARYKEDSGKEAAKARERAAILEKEAAEAKAEAAKANERILEMQKMRRLDKDKAEALKSLLKSEWFQKSPKPKLRIGAVADAEAQIYAMDFFALFKSCNVDIYPTPGGTWPNEILQLEPSAEGLTLTVKSIANPNQAFPRFERLMLSIGLKMRIEEDPQYGDNAAMLAVLRKPT